VGLKCQVRSTRALFLLAQTRENVSATKAHDHHRQGDVRLSTSDAARRIIRFPGDHFGLAIVGQQWNPVRPLTVSG
jgi:hypothetical protein